VQAYAWKAIIRSIVISRHRDTGRNYSIKITTNPSKCDRFKYLRKNDSGKS
jgi:hypothetical protein